MNIRFPANIESFPESVQKLPLAIRTNTRARLIASLIAVVVAVALVWAVVRLFSGASTPAHPAPPVKVAAIQQTDVTVVEHTLGTVIANATVQITARVDGQMMSAAFKEGDVVHAGQLIFRLDPRPFTAALEQAKASLAKDQAMLLSAQNDRKRYDTLFKAGAASSQQRDQADATAKGMVASVQSDRAAVDVAKLNLDYSQIHSPIDGKTGPILVQPGNLVVANGTSPLVTITQIQPVKVSFSLPQSDLPRIQERQHTGALTASIDTHTASGKPLLAQIDFVGNAVSNTTGTIELRATFANTDMSLVPGQLIDVSVALNNLRSALIVPREAVNVGPNGRYVYNVTKDGNAVLQPVDVLFDNGETMAISSRLKKGDMIITDGQLRVVPGQPVSIAKSGGVAHKAP